MEKKRRHPRCRLRAGQAGVRFPAAISVWADDNEAMAMTEQEWLACSDSDAMMDFLRGSPSIGVTPRKLRLFMLAAAYYFDEASRAPHWQPVHLAAEQFADKKASWEDLWRTYHAAASRRAGTMPTLTLVGEIVQDWLHNSSDVRMRIPHFHGFSNLLYRGIVSAVPLAGSLVREIFPNPFRPVTLNPAWQTSNVTALAQAIYDERAFERLPILADALEDAGCDNADILNHCRQPGEHVRGCWVVDLVLCKE
jgi:hypothetical protein